MGREKSRGPLLGRVADNTRPRHGSITEENSPFDGVMAP